MDTGMEDTTFRSFNPSKNFETPVPIILFQSGYGSTSESHAPLLQAISNAGYVVVVPDREDDKKGGKESVELAFAGFAEGKPASDYNAMSTDGTHLAAALDWIKAQTVVNGVLREPQGLVQNAPGQGAGTDQRNGILHDH